MMKPRKENNHDLLRRILRVRLLAKRYGIPLCDRGRLKVMTDGELHAYYFNLSARIKRLVLDQNPAIAQRWKFYDNMPVWEFVERIDRLRAHQERNSRLAREIGLEPITTPVESPQRNGMAEAFVPTVKRD
jgi:hypothetical protein